MEPYYKAYDARYRIVHARGLRWSGETPTPLVLETLLSCGIAPETPILELGCGEGRDAGVLLEQGYHLLATDVSREAIAFCRKTMPQYAGHFQILDVLRDEHPARYGFLYAVAVVHMLVPDEDRQGFYRFVRDHLTEDGLALICTMGDGETELQTDIREAFRPSPRAHPAGPITVAGTSCRMVSFSTFERELEQSGLVPLRRGIAPSPPDFDRLMYALVRRKPEG